MGPGGASCLDSSVAHGGFEVNGKAELPSPQALTQRSRSHGLRALGTGHLPQSDPLVHLTTQGQQGGLARHGLGVALSGHGCGMGPPVFSVACSGLRALNSSLLWLPEHTKWKEG